MECDCHSYEDIELYRESIDKRIRKTGHIKTHLEQLAVFPDRSCTLWKCPVCGQLWQSSHAWKWGEREYFYKVPAITVAEWLDDHFVKPDELLNYGSLLAHISFVEIDQKCRKCGRNAIEYSVFCKKHHLESMQKTHAFPEFPKGRIFDFHQHYDEGESEN
ncbi:MAG: hypothetical protein JSS81_29140 [Acidobacteria bacterium]|nr:hypothetical protein [Acidobacteriota bacterium]